MEERRSFFFANKKEAKKTLLTLARAGEMTGAPANKSFLRAFFQKSATFTLLASLLTACSIPTPPAFYHIPAPASAPPGSLVSAQAFPSVAGAKAYRVLYVSTDIHGARIPVSGIVYVPAAPPPPGGRDVVAWAHATTGIAPGCAPSLDSGGKFAGSIPGLGDFIAAGDIVAATDYQGMGVAGVHPYLIGRSEGAAIIDSVRAARQLPGADISGKYVVWGHSQGAQAVLMAGEMAHGYAPELSLAGVAAAAPVTDLKGELTEPFKDNVGRLLAAYVYYTWSRTYDVPITTIVYPQAVAAVNKTASKCINTLGEGINAVLAARALNPVFRSHPPQSTPPWPGLFDENSPGHAAAGAPLLILQGTADPTVEPHWTRSFVSLVCSKHETIEFLQYKGVKHLDIADKSEPDVAAWIRDRFAGKPAPDNCPG
jgi:alpha-beta hydrolase superfamily lysophospholipase